MSAVAITVVAVNNFPYLAESDSDNFPDSIAATPEQEPILSQEPFFLVEEAADATLSDFELKADGTIYQMNVLSTGYNRSNQAYQLNATPLTFTSQQAKQPDNIKINSEKAEY